MKSILVTGIVAFAIGCSGSPSGKEPVGAGNENSSSANQSTDTDLFALLRGGGQTYPAVTAEEIEKQAEIVAIGKLVDVSEGALLSYTDSPDRQGRPSVVLTLEVRELIKGESHDGNVYFEEMPDEPAPVETFATALPKYDVMVFIRSEAPGGRLEREGLEWVNPLAGYPVGVMPRELVTRQGVLAEVEQRIVQVYEPVEDGPFRLYPNATSFSDVVQEIRARQ